MAIKTFGKTPVAAWPASPNTAEIFEAKVNAAAAIRYAERAIWQQPTITKNIKQP